MTTPQSQQTREEKMDQEIARLISECSDQNKKLGGSEILMGSGRELHLKLEKLFAQAIQSAREEERKKFFENKNVTVEIESGKLFIKVGEISSTWNLHLNDGDAKEDFYSAVYIDNEKTRHWTMSHSSQEKEAYQTLFEKRVKEIQALSQEGEYVCEILK